MGRGDGAAGGRKGYEKNKQGFRRSVRTKIWGPQTETGREREEERLGKQQTRKRKSKQNNVGISRERSKDGGKNTKGYISG